MQVFTKEKTPKTGWHSYRKKHVTSAIRIAGPFRVITREGPLECPDGYLALDTDHWPYPVARSEFEKIYERVNEQEVQADAESEPTCRCGDKTYRDNFGCPVHDWRTA